MTDQTVYLDHDEAVIIEMYSKRNRNEVIAVMEDSYCMALPPAMIKTFKNAIYKLKDMSDDEYENYDFNVLESVGV